MLYYRNKVYVWEWVFTCFFFRQKQKGNLEIFFFFIEKVDEGKIGNPKRRQCGVFLLSEWRNQQIFYSILTTCIRV